MSVDTLLTHCTLFKRLAARLSHQATIEHNRTIVPSRHPRVASEAQEVYQQSRLSRTHDIGSVMRIGFATKSWVSKL
jgi:hypothetical protein